MLISQDCTGRSRDGRGSLGFFSLQGKSHTIHLLAAPWGLLSGGTKYWSKGSTVRGLHRRSAKGGGYMSLFFRVTPLPGPNNDTWFLSGQTETLKAKCFPIQFSKGYSDCSTVYKSKRHNQPNIHLFGTGYVRFGAIMLQNTIGSFKWIRKSAVCTV